MPVSNDFRNSGCYVANAGVKQEFTGKERDAESGLDYFGARYFSGAQGRFTSPDEPFVDQWAQNPQSWNLYSYGRNNPLRFVDPTGQGCTVSRNSYTDNSDPGPDCKTVMAGNGEAQQVNVGVGRDEANLIALQRLGEQLSDFHQWSQVVTGGVLGAGSIAAPLPTAIVQCVVGSCDKGNLVAATIPLPGTGKLAELAAEHAFVKHVLVQGEFPGIRTTSQMRRLVTSIFADARSLVRNLSGGRLAVWSEENSAVVIINSRNPGKSTIFQPASGKAYFDGLK
jgi:RHS repeat-associated protein